MSVQSTALALQGLALQRMAKYSSVCEDCDKNSESSKTLIYTGMGLLDDKTRLEFLRRTSETLEHSRKNAEERSKRAYEESSKLADEALIELKKASSAIQSHHEGRQAEVKRASARILADYKNSKGKMSDQEARRKLTGVFNDVNVSLPTDLQSKMDNASSMLSSLSQKTVDIHMAAMLDEHYAAALNFNNINILNFEFRMGLTPSKVSLVNTISSGRFRSNAANSIDNSLHSLHSNIMVDDSISKSTFGKMKTQMINEIAN